MEKMTDEQRQIVMDNYNLPHYVMRKKFPSYYPGSYEYEDLSQEGYLGLCLAAMRYDSDRSMFSTYAFNYIWGYILRYLNTKSGWAFHIRPDQKTYKHISYSSLNECTCDVDSREPKELYEIIPDRKANVYDELEAWIDAVPAFKKANQKYGEQLLYLLVEGLTQKEIENVIGISQTQISRIMTKAKDIYHTVKKYDPRYPDDVVLEMKMKGYSNKLIADILNADTTYVKRTLLNMKKGN